MFCFQHKRFERGKRIYIHTGKKKFLIILFLSFRGVLKHLEDFQPTFTCSKVTMETPEQCRGSVKSQQ